MNSDKEQLLNNVTLDNLKESFYAPQNLNQKDSSILASISQASIQSLESAMGVLSHLITNLKIYKECLIDSINLQAERVDISSKYAKDIPQQSHILPGIIQTPPDYDLVSIRSDNDRMLQIKDSVDKAVTQKEIYMRIAEEDVRLFLAAWKRLSYQNASLDQFIDSLSKTINENYI
jgi:Ni,Fe-hydrogenase I large subunit